MESKEAIGLVSIVELVSIGGFVSALLQADKPKQKTIHSKMLNILFIC